MTEADPKIIIQVPTLPTKGKRGPQAKRVSKREEKGQ
jgi:hypothetical protein